MAKKSVRYKGKRLVRYRGGFVDPEDHSGPNFKPGRVYYFKKKKRRKNKKGRSKKGRGKFWWRKKYKHYIEGDHLTQTGSLPSKLDGRRINYWKCVYCAGGDESDLCVYTPIFKPKRRGISKLLDILGL